MKKLLVLALVLAMAGMANAAITFSTLSANPGTSVEEVTLAPSDTIVIDIYATDVIEQGSMYVGMVLGGEGGGHLDISQAVVNYVGSPSWVAWNEDAGIEELLGTIPYSVQTLETDNQPPIDDVVGQLFSNIIFHCDEAGIDVTIGLFSGSDGSMLDSIIVHQTPEPITIGLLGLGAMFLRRRK